MYSLLVQIIYSHQYIVGKKFKKSINYLSAFLNLGYLVDIWHSKRLNNCKFHTQNLVNGILKFKGNVILLDSMQDDINIDSVIMPAISQS